MRLHPVRTGNESTVGMNSKRHGRWVLEMYHWYKSRSACRLNTCTHAHPLNLSDTNICIHITTNYGVQSLTTICAIVGCAM